jgi:hypothetical protein
VLPALQGQDVAITPKSQNPKSYLKNGVFRRRFGLGDFFAAAAGGAAADFF